MDALEPRSAFGIEYASAPESPAIVSIAPRYELFIGGRWVMPKEQRYLRTINPATEEPLTEVADAGAEDVDDAVRAARAAWPAWAALPGRERGKYGYRIARQLQERAREFSVLETLDGGKPIKESRDVDVPLAAAHFFYYAGWADKLEYAAPGRVTRPVGVAGQIIPWNFPLLMAAWKLAPALATGNVCVLKPAETTPLTALLLAQVCDEAGLPPGVVNIVTGGPETGAALVAHPDVDKIAFTGSTTVGKAIQKAVAGRGKKVTLELGGKAANVVFEDAALDQAVEGIVNGIFFNQGHVCCAGSRLLVQESVADVVIDKLETRLTTLRVGDPLDKNTDLGAINSAAQLERIEELYAAGVSEGAEPYQPQCTLPDRGFWFRPTVFTNVSQSHRIAREEIFGPVLSVLTFRTPAEAVEKANNTPYGLSAGVWTEKGAKILWMADRLRAGVVWANTFNRFDPGSPFGGFQESGFGREGGVAGLYPYVHLERAHPGQAQVGGAVGRSPVAGDRAPETGAAAGQAQVGGAVGRSPVAGDRAPESGAAAGQAQVGGAVGRSPVAGDRAPESGAAAGQAQVGGAVGRSPVAGDRAPESGAAAGQAQVGGAVGRSPVAGDRAPESGAAAGQAQVGGAVGRSPVAGDRAPESEAASTRPQVGGGAK